MDIDNFVPKAHFTNFNQLNVKIDKIYLWNDCEILIRGFSIEIYIYAIDKHETIK